MPIQNIKRNAGIIGTITGVIGLIFSSLSVYKHFDGRLDTLEKESAAISSDTESRNSRVRLQFIDLQIEMIKVELRTLDRIDLRNEIDERLHRVLEQQLISLNEERTRILAEQ